MGQYSMTLTESLDALRRVIASGGPRVVVSTGDLQRRAAVLRDQCNKSRHGAARWSSPRSSDNGSRAEVEALLASLWADVLGLPSVGPNESFFELGGDSILGIRMVNALRERFGIDFPTSGLFETPTIRGLADLIVKSPAEPEVALGESVERGERRRLARGQAAAKPRVHASDEEEQA